jgi:hydrogenase maturation protein HypF
MGASTRIRIQIHGAVQGVGFRPFVYRTASELGIAGWVHNTPAGVTIEAEGPEPVLHRFLDRVKRKRPPRAFIQSCQHTFLDPVGHSDFRIRKSTGDGQTKALIMPDMATCPECVAELMDPGDRRYLYPFTNCTNCGPRFSIIRALPYDRSRTTMRRFRMCDRCQSEYEDPLDRRFHAQPNACPECGPRLELWTPEGECTARATAALEEAAASVSHGEIVALKGLGGYHLVVDALNEDAVQRLRRLKHREEKPLALMYPDVKSVREHCVLEMDAERLLASPEAPIVLLPRLAHAEVAQGIAVRNPYLGVMLPYTPLHHLLMRLLRRPIVATSGNRSDEPIATDEDDALRRLNRIADRFLVHNRPIARAVDDSVVQYVMGREQILRRARGFAPLPVSAKRIPCCTLAFGAHQKNTVAVAVEGEVFLSQHVGDLDTPESIAAFEGAVRDLPRLYDVQPELVVSDLHPDYVSTRRAEKTGLPVHRVQHHHAHVLSCMADHKLTGPVLGVAWDGTGYGVDGTIWGGEFLHVDGDTFERVAHLRTFALPGGDAAIREPRRCALALLFERYGRDALQMRDLIPVTSFSEAELGILGQMLKQRIHAPTTSSAGRLFDAVASLCGIRQVTSFEGQAAMELEFAARSHTPQQAYAYRWCQEPGKSRVLDWGPMVDALLTDLRRQVDVGIIATRFHRTLAEAAAELARHESAERVILTGGCFQNRLLSELLIRRLRELGIRVYWHQRLPPNDGGIAAGQIMAAAQCKDHRKRERVPGHTRQAPRDHL